MRISKIRHKSIHRAIALAVVCLMLLQDAACAMPRQDSDKLAPPSHFYTPKARIAPAENGTFKVIFDDDDESFRQDAVSYYLAILIGQYLKLGISANTLRPDIEDVLEALNKHVGDDSLIKAWQSDPVLAGFDISKSFFNEKENAYYLPMARGNDIPFFYKYYLDLKEGEAPDMAFPLGDGTNVYVKLDVSAKGQELLPESLEIFRIFHDLGNILYHVITNMDAITEESQDAGIRQLASKIQNIIDRISSIRSNN
jgi:hypothetical protein